jgi:hypothetical protein
VISPLWICHVTCGFRGWTTMPCASGMRTGRSPLWRICYGRSSWIMGTRPDSTLVEYKSFIRLGQPRRFVSLTIIGCSILFLALEFVFRFTGTLQSIGLYPSPDGSFQLVHSLGFLVLHRDCWSLVLNVVCFANWNKCH